MVEQLVLESLQRVLWYVQCCEKQFAELQRAQSGEARRKELTEKRRELEKAKQRIHELDGIIQKLTRIQPWVTSRRNGTLRSPIAGKRTAQSESASPRMENEVNISAAEEEDLQRFIEKVQRVTRMTELTPELVHEFIEKIVVSKPITGTGSDTRQSTSTTTEWASYGNRLPRRWSDTSRST